MPFSTHCCCSHKSTSKCFCGFLHIFSFQIPFPESFTLSCHFFRKRGFSKDVIWSSGLICYIWLLAPVVLVCVHEQHSRNPQISDETQHTATCRLSDGRSSTWPSPMIFHRQVISSRYMCLTVGADCWPSSSIILKIKCYMLQYQEAFSSLLTPQAAERGCP